MLHVLLGILKVIGILLTVLLGLILMVLLTVLFAPLRYEISGSKRGEIQARGRVSWLLRIVTFRGGYEKGEAYAKLKLFGIPVADLLAEEEGPKEVKKPKKAKKPKAEKAQETEKMPVQATKPETAAVPAAEKVTPVSAAEEEKPGFFEKFSQKISGIRNKIKNLKYTFQRFCAKIKEGREFILDERSKAAFRLCKNELLRLLKKLLPRKLKGDIHFGFEDPAMTGEVLGGISIFYPFFMDNVKINPDFEETCLEGELYLKGKLQVAVLLPTLWRLWRDPNIRFLYRRFWG